jgi:hypothetical protein
VAGNSFGGIQVVLGAERKTDYCAAVDSAGAALTWSGSPEPPADSIRGDEGPGIFGTARICLILLDKASGFHLEPWIFRTHYRMYRCTIFESC